MNFTSPGFPWQYPPNLECQWHIFAEDDMIIVLRIRRFDLESGFDYLTVGNGNTANKDRIARLTGVSKVRAVSSGSSIIWMILSSDGTGSMAGFLLQIEQIYPGEITGKLS